MTSRTRMRAGLVALGTTLQLLLSACDSRVDTPTAVSPVNGPRAQSAPDSPAAAPGADTGWVATPAGWFHSSCVYEIEDGAVVRGDSVVGRGGQRRVLPPCAHPHREAPERGGRPLPPPSTNGYIIWNHETVSAPNAYRGVSVSWTVPDAPTVGYSSGSVYFTFPGLVNDTYILQPVLRYTSSGWAYASWRCDTGQNCTHSPYQSTTSGHQITGTIATNSCNGSTCDFTVTTTDATISVSTSATWTDTDNYREAVGTAIETYNLYTCGQYPLAPLRYTNMVLSDKNGTRSPTFVLVGTNFYGVDCGFAVQWSAPTILTRENLPTGPINGFTAVVTGNECSYNVMANGGWGGPYSYSWFDGDYSISSGQYSNGVTGNFTTDGQHVLQVQLTDAQGSVGYASISVNSATVQSFLCQR